MGQQQLLLVILVTIIVGIATVVAINTFSSAADSANLDSVRQDVASIAAAAQGYYIKPTMLGGGGNTFTGLTFNTMAFAADSIDGTNGTTATNSNGRYVLTVNAGNVVVVAHPASRITGSVTLSSAASNTLQATITEGNIAWDDNN
ncbi:MAG: hypothetical protein MI700_01695 [Balneolales bacterium]|nr:hypothetical protein [Balneolales bacterium]